MKNRKIIKFAKTLFKQSFRDGLVDPQKVQQILKETVVQKPISLLPTLKLYKKLIEKALQKETISIETASQIKEKSELEKVLLIKTHAKKVSFKTNPKIVLGAKITHGDWIWDATLDAKLKQLMANN